MDRRVRGGYGVNSAHERRLEVFVEDDGLLHVVEYFRNHGGRRGAVVRGTSPLGHWTGARVAERSAG